MKYEEQRNRSVLKLCGVPIIGGCIFKSWSMFEFIQAILTRIPKALCFSNGSMASRHHNVHIEFSEQLQWRHFPKP